MIGTMRLIMNDGQLQTVEQVRQFLEGSEMVGFRGLTAKEKYCWIEEMLIRFSYPGLKRAEKGKWCMIETRCFSSEARLFRMPPTRYMMAPWYVEFLQQLRGLLTK